VFFFSDGQRHPCSVQTHCLCNLSAAFRAQVVYRHTALYFEGMQHSGVVQAVYRHTACAFVVAGMCSALFKLFFHCSFLFPQRWAL